MASSSDKIISQDIVLSVIALNNQGVIRELLMNATSEGPVSLLQLQELLESSDCQNKISDMYFNKTPKELKKAFEWSLKFAKQGDLTGIKRVASTYENEQGVAMSKGHAMHWYFKAFKTYGNVEAMYCLGKIFKKDGDMKQALMWFKRGLDKGHVQSKLEVEKLFNKRIWLSYNELALLSVEERLEALELGKEKEKVVKPQQDNQEDVNTVLRNQETQIKAILKGLQ